MNERQTDAIDAYAAKLERENAKLKAIIKNGPKVAKKFAHDYGYMTDPFELRKALRDMMDMNATLMAKNNRIVSESKRMEEWNNKLVKEHYELKKQPAPDYSSWKCPICGLSSNYTTNRCADQKCGGRREQVPAPAPRVTDILEALRDYRCQYTRDADGNGLSLVDMLTPDYESDITNGISEMEILADDIEAHLLDKQPAPKATDAPMTLDGVTVAFSNVMYERKRQDAEWGEKNHRPEKWLTILLEELGEAARALLEQTAMKYRDEMVHVASVAVAAIEAFDKNNPRDGHNTEITQSIDRLIQNIEESK